MKRFHTCKYLFLSLDVNGMTLLEHLHNKVIYLHGRVRDGVDEMMHDGFDEALGMVVRCTG